MKERLALVVGVVIVLVLLFGRAVLPGHLPADYTVMRDTYHLSVICASYGERVFGGLSPLWLDEIGGGYPLHALWMYGCFAPTALFWSLLAFESAFTWSIIVHLALGAAGMHALLKSEGADRAGALTGAVLFAISEYTIGRTAAGHANQIWALGWAPWVLWAVQRAVHGRRHGVAALAAVGTLALLAGHVQLWFFLGPFAVVYALVETSAVRDRRGALQRLVIAALLVVVLTAVQWLPAAELALISGRPEVSADLLREWSAPAYALAAKIAPGMLGFRPDGYYADQAFEHEHSGLGSAAVFLLVLLGLRRDRRRVLLAVTAVFGLVLALGEHFGPSAWVQGLPVLGWGRVAARTQVLTLLAGSMLAAHGVSDVVRMEADARRRVLVAGALTLAVAIACTAVVYVETATFVWPRPLFRSSVSHATAFTKVALPALALSLIGALLVGGTLLLVQRRRAFAPAVAVVALIGVWLAGLPLVEGVSTDFMKIDWTARLPRDALEHRVFLLDLRTPYVERAGLRSFRRPAHVDTRYIDALRQKTAAASARWLDIGSGFQIDVTRRGPPTGFPEGVRIRPTLTPPMGRARFFRSADAAGSDAEALRRLRDGLDGLLISGGSGYGGPLPPSLTRVAVSGGGSQLVCDLTAPSDGWLLLSEKWYPGWTCEVNGAPVTIERGNVALRAVRVPAGAVRAVFRYEPVPLRIGAAASLLGLLVLVGLVIAGRRGGVPEAQ